MKDDAIVVAILGVSREVLDGFRALLRKQLQSDVALGCVDDSTMRQDKRSLLLIATLARAGIRKSRLLIEDVPTLSLRNCQNMLTLV